MGVFIGVLAAAACQAVIAAIAPRSAIEDVEIFGVSLRDDARTAFEKLVAGGFQTEHTRYMDWWQGELEFSQGKRSTRGGYAEIVLGRDGAELVFIRSVIYRNQFPFDPEAEATAARDMFGLAPDEPDCKAGEYSASCGIDAIDQSASYLMTVLGKVQRYESVTLNGRLPQPTGPPPEPERAPLDLSALTTIPPPALPNPNWEACSLAGLSAALNPLVPDWEPEINRLKDSFARDNPIHRLQAPEHYAESTVWITGLGSSGGSRDPKMCTSPFAVSDVEWMNDQYLIDPIDKRDAVLNEQLPDAMAATGLTEVQIRAILLGDTATPQVTDQQVRQLYAFIEALGRRELALEINDSALTFWLFSPDLAVERAGGITGSQNLDNPLRVISRTADGHFGWDYHAEINLLVALADPRRDSLGGAEQFDPDDFSVLPLSGFSPNVFMRAYVYSRPPDHILERYPFITTPEWPVPETRNAIMVERQGDFVSYTCDGETRISFMGRQISRWGYLEGTLATLSTWDPDGDTVPAVLHLRPVDGYLASTIETYEIVATGNAACPYAVKVSDFDAASGGFFHVYGHITIPNKAGLPIIPGTRGRTVRVGIAPQP